MPRAPRPRVTAMLLDIDDTLVDTRSAFHAAVSAVASTWLPHIEVARHDELARRWIADVGGHFREYTRGEATITEQRRRRAADLQRTFGGTDLDDAQFAAWEVAYDAAFRASWQLHPDAVELLDALDHAGIPTGALSNSSRDLSLAKLDRLGLAERLPLLASPDDLGFGKPDPRVFHLACERLGSDPTTTAYVGDELDVDAQGAQAAGLLGIWLHRAGPVSASAAGGVLVVSALTGVVDVVDLGGHWARR